ncbi:MAG: sensor histidine kinase [Elusimicrobiales bacterium]
MSEQTLPTNFLPAEMAAPAEVERQRAMLAASPLIAATLDGMLNLAMILNRQRQAVFVNKPFREFLAANGIEGIIGKRMGNLVGCKHPPESEGGCGTTEACARCGAAQSLAQALKGVESANECRILSHTVGEDLDLRISVTPLKHGGEDFLLMSLLDISSEKRRVVMERLFFHDIINTAGGVQGLLSLVEVSDPAEARTYVRSAAKASDRMVEQILSQKDLAAAERGDLQPKAEEVSSLEFLREAAGLFAAHEAAKNKTLVLSPDCEDVRIRTDRTLLSRVIGNLLKNALEAESSGATVTLACKKSVAGAVFTVHNPSRMPEDSRLQVFQRSFSTKGAGRGLGTYSIRLLTEKYLKGRVSFSTGPEGTAFRAEFPASL